MTYFDHECKVSTVAMSPTSEIMACGLLNQTVAIWQTRPVKKRLRTLSVRHTNATSIKFSPCGQYLLTFGPNYLQPILWNVETGKLIRRFDCDSTISEIWYCSDGKQIAAFSRKKSCFIFWNVGSEQMSKKIDLTGSDFHLATLSPDFRRAVSTRYHRVFVWDLKDTKKSLHTISHLSQVVCVAISPNNHIMATSTYGRFLKIWDMETGKCLSSRSGLFRFKNVNFSPRGTFIATKQGLKTLRLFDINSLKRLTCFLGNAEIHHFDFPHDCSACVMQSWPDKRVSIQSMFVEPDLFFGEILPLLFEFPPYVLLDIIHQSFGIFWKEPLLVTNEFQCDQKISIILKMVKTAQKILDSKKSIRSLNFEDK